MQCSVYGTHFCGAEHHQHVVLCVRSLCLFVVSKKFFRPDSGSDAGSHIAGPGCENSRDGNTALSGKIETLWKKKSILLAECVGFNSSCHKCVDPSFNRSYLMLL